MHDAAVTGVCEVGERLGSVVEKLRQRDAGAAAEDAEVLSGDKIHDHDELPRVQEGVVQGSDVEVVQRGEELDLAPEARSAISGVPACSGRTH